jgi:glycosyltransferase involved in cell wall biosynthesis
VFHRRRTDAWDDDLRLNDGQMSSSSAHTHVADVETTRNSGRLPSRLLDVLVLAPVPPPLGGISVHVSRLVPHLQRAGLEVGVLNHFRSTDADFVLGALNRNPINYFRMPRRIRARVVHYHHSHWLTLLAVALGRHRTGSRYVLTIHGNDVSGLLKSRVSMLRWATRWAVNRFDAIIVVNPDIRSAIEGHVNPVPIEVLPAFLEAPAEESLYDASLEDFLASGRTLLVCAARVYFLPNRRDLYGLDLAVEAFAALAADWPDLRLALFIADRPSGGHGARHLSALARRLDEASLRDRTIFVFGTPLTPAFRHDAIFVRPTRAEGDALSVREALQAGVPVVASDVVGRPAGTSTFASEDRADFRRALVEVLDNTKETAKRPVVTGNDATSGDELVAALLRIYRRQIGLAKSDASD